MSPTHERCQTFLRIIAKSRPLVVLPAAAALLLSAGCQNRSLANLRWSQREEGCARIANWLVDHEQSRPKKLAWTVGAIEQSEQLHRRKAAAWPGRLNDSLDEEVAHWRHQRPRIKAELDRQMRGRPDRIEAIAIWMWI